MTARGVTFTPLSITGLKLWLKADSLVLSDNDPVSTWTDSSGNSNTVTGAGTARPTYKATGGSGSLPCVQFDGTNDVLTKDPWSGGNISQPDTVIAVYDTGRPLEGGTDPNRQMFNPSLPSAGLYSGLVFTTGITLASNTFLIMSGIFNGASSKIYINSGSANTGDAGTGSSSKITMGTDGSSFFAGKVCELLMYDSALSDANRGLVEGYLRSKWATP